ncbi:MAG TPA: hypothetical protein VMW11_02490 [Candidatus Dormibacteraeota bacterium]|nr:hypothetical protein [Candidatus Dormibacteraeota bacterium]
MNDSVVVERTRWRTRYRDRGCECGCGGFFFVLIVGVLFSLFNVVAGVGVSVRVPFTQSNITVAGSVGAKDKALNALPDYVQGRLGKNQNFFNNSTTMTIGPAEGTALVVIGNQGGAPPIDLHIFLH